MHALLLAALWVLASREGATVTVRAGGLTPHARYVVAIDLATPHASVACQQQWARAVLADARGRVTARLAPAGPCAVRFDRDGWLATIDGPGTSLRSAIFH